MVVSDEKMDIHLGRFDNHKKLAKALRENIKVDLNNLVFVCIGTDRSTGDSFGPLIGTMLKEKGYKNVIGDIDEPVHAVNLDERITEIVEGKTIIAIDACLGRKSNVGKISLNKGKLSPGAGVGKELTKVGNFHLVGIVNVSGFMELFVLQNTRLSLVMKMAKEVSCAIETAFPLGIKTKEENHESVTTN